MLESAQNRTDSSTCHVDLHCTLGLKRKTHFPYHKQKNSKNSDALGARCTRQSHRWQNFNFLGQMSVFSEPSPPCRKQASRNAGKKARLHPIIVRSNIFFPLFLSSSYFLQNIFGCGCFIRRWTGNVCKRITDFPCMLQYWESQSSTCIPAVLKEVPTAFFSPFM